MDFPKHPCKQFEATTVIRWRGGLPQFQRRTDNSNQCPTASLKKNQQRRQIQGHLTR